MYKTYPHASADWDARRARCVQLRDPRTLLVYYLLQGVSEFDWGAAGPAAGYCSQCSSCHAAHTSSRSLRGIKIPNKKSSISVLSNSSGISEMSRPGIYTFTRKHVKMHLKKFLGVFWGFYSEGCTGIYRARPVPPDGGENKNGRNLSFFTGVSEFDCWARCASGAAGDPGRWVRENFGSFREFLRSFGELRSVSCAPGAGRPDAGKLSTGYPQVFLY